MKTGIFSGNGTMMAGTFEDKLTVWDVTTDEPKEVHSITLPNTFGVGDRAFSKDGKTLGAACSDSVVRFWDISGAKVKELPSLPKQGELHSSRLLTAPLTGALIALTMSQKEGVTVWDVNGAEFKKREGSIPFIGYANFALAGDGKTLAHWQDDLFIYDLSGEKVVERMTVRHPPYSFSSVVAVSPDGKSLVTGSRADGAVRLWDIAGDKPRELHPNPGRTNPFLVCLATDGRTLAVADAGAVSLWDLGGAEPKGGPVLKQEGVNSVAFSADGKTLTVAGGRAVVLWDLTKAQPEEKAVLNGAVGAVGDILLSLSRDGKLVARVTRGEAADRLEVLDVASDRLKQRPAVFQSSTKLHGLAFSPDGKTLAASCPDGKARLWDVNASGTVKPTEIPGGGPAAVKFSDDGKFLLTSSPSDVSVWELSGTVARRRYTLPAQTHPLVLIAPDGQTIITAHWRNGTIDFWGMIPEAKQRQLELAGKKQEPRLTWRLSGKINAAALSPDGKHLITANANGTVYVMRLVESTKP